NYRIEGRGSWPGVNSYWEAGGGGESKAPDVVPDAKDAAVRCGRNGGDPCVLVRQFLSELRSGKLSGVRTVAAVGLYDGAMRASFEETGMGCGLEVDMIAQAHASDLLTTPYVFNPEESAAMAKAGADIIVAHMGVTVGGSIGATPAKSLDTCVAEV